MKDLNHLFALLTIVLCLFIWHPASAKQHDRTLAMSVGALKTAIKKGETVFIVDVRNKREYEKVRIHDSMNIPLHFVKTKNFLKAGSLILINNGYHYTQLEQECEDLRQLGFNAFILDGGLNHWRQKGGELEGNVFAQKEINRIDPMHFQQEKDFESHVIIDVSEKRSDEARGLVPGVIRMPGLRGNLKKVLSRMNRPFASILMINNDGVGYEKIEKKAHKIGLEKVFFLKDGVQGYSRFLNFTARANMPKENRVKSVSGCKSCGEKRKRESW